MHLFRTLCLSILIAGLSPAVSAGPELKDIAARSVHLGYAVPESEWFYIEARVDESHPGTYICAAAFDRGYLGVQELPHGGQVVLFSVWDPGSQHDMKARADAVREEDRVEVLFSDPGARIRRFGGEGSGGQCMMPFEWKTGEWIRFAVHARTEPGKTTFTGYVADAKTGEWRRLASFRTRTDGVAVKDSYSFVEDFRRNRISATQVRAASFRRAGGVGRDGTWRPAARARFTADGNPVVNIDAGVGGDGAYFLATGGETVNKTTKLWSSVHRPVPEEEAKAPTLPPAPEM